MSRSKNKFIFQNSPEMGGEVVVSSNQETLKEIPSGAEMVDSLASLDPFPVNEVKDDLGLTERDTAGIDNIGLLLEAVV